MPFSPGQTYVGGQLLAQGLQQFGAGIGSGIQARQERLESLKKQNAAAKGLRQAFTNLGLMERDEAEALGFDALAAFGSQASNMLGQPLRQQQVRGAELSNQQTERGLQKDEARDAVAAEIARVEGAKDPRVRVVAEKAGELSAEDQFAFMDRIQQQGFRSREAVAQAMKAEADAEKSLIELEGLQENLAIGLSEDKKKDAMALGKEIRSSPEVREFMKAKGLLSGLRENAASAVERQGPLDIALIFSFMKTLDPASTVREGEFAAAEQATGVPTRILNAYNKAVDGNFLGEEQVKQFVLAAEKAVEGSAKTANEVRSRVIGQGDALKVDSKFFAGDEFSVYPTFSSVEEVESAGLPVGTKVMIGGRPAIIE